MPEQESPPKRAGATDAPVGPSAPHEEKPDADVLEQRAVALPDDSAYEEDDLPEELPDQPR